MKKITFIITLFLAFVFTNSALSQTRRYVRAASVGTGDGSSWGNASSNLQAMIDASAPYDEVWVGKGTYHPTAHVGYNAAHVAYTDDRHKSFYNTTGALLYGGFNGNESSLGLRNFGAYKTILSGDLLGNDVGFTNNAENVYHVVVFATSALTTLDGFVITGGNTTGMPPTYFNDAPTYSQIQSDGAGYLGYQNANLTSDVFTNNYSTGNGGAIHLSTGGLHVDIVNSLFVNNRAAQGSAIYIDGQEPLNARVRVTNCTMANNISTGATIFDIGTVLCEIWNSIVWNNTDGAQTNFDVYESIVQNIITTGGAHAMGGASQADPLFINAADPDGADNIFGTSDDGFIPQCGPAINTGNNNFLPWTLPSRDIKGGSRIQSSNPDLGAYETPLYGPVTGISVSMGFAHNPFYYIDDDNPNNDLPSDGLCEGGIVNFYASNGNSGGVYQWKRNGINVGTNSPSYRPSDCHQGDLVYCLFTAPASCGGASNVQSNTVSVDSVSVGLPVIPSVITGPVNVCPYINGPAVTYKINKAPGAKIYVWPQNSTGMTITHPNGLGVNDTIISVIFTTGFVPGSLTVGGGNWCGLGRMKNLTLNTNLASQAGTITGPVDLCPFMQSVTNPSGIPATYTIRKVVDASSYVWTVPADAIITSHPGGAGFNDTIIAVVYNSNFVSGSVTAQAVNVCGAKSARAVSVSRKVSGTPGSIVGPTTVCDYKQSSSNPTGTPVDYHIKKVTYATSYTWTIPAGASAVHPQPSGVNDTIITVTYSSGFTGGAITVKSNTNCNTSVVRSLSISYLLPSTPGTITATIATACPQRQITYSLVALPTRATSVLWTAPASGTIISGQGTLSLVVQYSGPTSVTDTIRVVGVNGCGTSTQRKLKVAALTGACRFTGKYNEQNVPAAVTITKPVITNNATGFDVTVMPNPSQQHFTLQLAGADINIPAMIQVTDAAGRTIEIKNHIQGTIIIGETYKRGIYFATITQGEKRKVVRLVKL
ncbi:MAG: T9SS type A sorting domain-containing protein [Ferruginibacter sp.]